MKLRCRSFLNAAAVSMVLHMVILSNVTRAEEVATGQIAKKSATAEPGLGEKTSSYFRDYLSDPRRSGSLAGSILGGALSAHPAGPILGSLVGFMVGKQSMFNEDKAQKERATMLYARRDIVPQGSDTLQTLSFTDSRGVTFDTPTTDIHAASLGSTGGQSQSMAPTFSREQIAAMCGGSTVIDSRFKALCFYSQGS